MYSELYFMGFRKRKSLENPLYCTGACNPSTDLKAQTSSKSEKHQVSQLVICSSSNISDLLPR